jgi:uncharacterized membrane protein
MTSKDSRLVWTAAAAFAALVAVLKLEQFLRLQTQAYDMGIHVNFLWNTAHGRWFWDSIKGVNYLGDHFSPGLAVLAPLLRIWPSAAALACAQSAALALGIPAVYRLALDRTGERDLAAWLCALYAVSPLVQASSAHDVHAVTFAVPLLLWGLTLPGARGLVLLAFAGTLQEDLWLCAAAAAWHRKERRAAGVFAACFGVSVLAMRAAAGPFRPAHWSFYAPARIAASLFTLDRPWGALRLLVPLAGLPLFAGRAGLALLVPLAYTWLGAQPQQGRLELHYGAPLIPFAFLAAAEGARRLKDPPGWALALALAVSLAWLPRYSRPLAPTKAEAAAKLFAMIPAGEPVAASFDLVPSLAARESIELWRPGSDPAGSWIALDAAPSYFDSSLQNDAQVREFLAPRLERLAFASEWLYLLKPRPAPGAEASK